MAEPQTKTPAASNPDPNADADPNQAQEQNSVNTVELEGSATTNPQPAQQAGPNPAANADASSQSQPQPGPEATPAQAAMPAGNQETASQPVSPPKAAPATGPKPKADSHDQSAPKAQPTSQTDAPVKAAPAGPSPEEITENNDQAPAANQTPGDQSQGQPQSAAQAPGTNPNTTNTPAQQSESAPSSDTTPGVTAQASGGFAQNGIKPQEKPQEQTTGAEKSAPGVKTETDPNTGVTVTSNPFPGQEPAAAQVPGEQSQPVTQQQGKQQPAPAQPAQPAAPAQPAQPTASAQPAQAQPQPAQATTPAQPAQAQSQPGQQPGPAQNPPAATTQAEAPGPIGEEVKKKPKKRGGGPSLFGLGRLGCRSIVTLLVIIPLLLLVALVAVIILRPEPVWGMVKSTVNGSVDNQGYGYSQDTGEEYRLATEIETAPPSPTDPSAYQLDLDQTEIAYLVDRKIANLDEVYADSRQGEVSILFNLTPSEDEPLWLELVMMQEAEGLEITKTSLGRFTVPSQVRQSIQDSLVTGLSFLNRDSAVAIVDELIGSEDIEITQVEFTDESLLVDFTRTSGPPPSNPEGIRPADGETPPDQLQPETDIDLEDPASDPDDIPTQDLP